MKWEKGRRKMDVRERYRRVFDAIRPEIRVITDRTVLERRRPIPKKIIVAVAAVLALIAISSAAFAADLWGVRKAVSRWINGKRVTYETRETNLRGFVREVYTDENGNDYKFSESGEEIGYLMNPEDVRSPEGTEDDGISEDDAVTIAWELGMKEFPDEFPGMELTSVLKDEGNKTVSVQYEQRLGEKGFVTGMYFYAIINPDGTVFAYGLPNRDELAGFDVSLLGGLTESSVLAEIEAYERELHGDSLSRYETRSIKLKKDAEGFYVEVLVFGYSKTDFALIPGEDEMFDGGNTLRFDID